MALFAIIIPSSFSPVSSIKEIFIISQYCKEFTSGRISIFTFFVVSFAIG